MTSLLVCFQATEGKNKDYINNPAMWASQSERCGNPFQAMENESVNSRGREMEEGSSLS